MRKCIAIQEAKQSGNELKKLDLVEKMLKELNTKASNKLRLVKADLEEGDSSVSIGALDDLAMKLEAVITAVTKL